MQKINLNYAWQYKPDYSITDLGESDINEGFKTVNLPHTNKVVDYNNFDEADYQFVSCYKKKVYIPEYFKEKALILEFEGVSSYMDLYINGKFITGHAGGYTPIKIDISENVIYGGDNLLTVICDSTERADIPPFGKVIDYLTYGGIYREVWLEVREKTYIKDLFVRTLQVQLPTKIIDIDIELSQAASEMYLEFTVVNSLNQPVSRFIFNTGTGIKRKIRGHVSNVELWSINKPVLYTLQAQLKQKDRLVDDFEVRIGFREAEFKTDGFFLNGEKLKLIGLNRHQSYPYVGYAMPESAQKRDADILKYELGVNIVRTSHYPQSRHFLDRCDEIGLLVFEEIPGWQHIGNEQWKERACRDVNDMIIRDRNHPSIVLWGVRINESADNNELYLKTNGIAHELDNTRQTGGVRNFKDSTLLEDVYTYNDFKHNGSNNALEQPSKVTKSSAPYLVTEHNGHMFPTKRFDNEERRLEHALRHARVLESMMGNERISGAIGWCMFDYNTHKEFGSGDRICYHGVSDMFRIPKLAWYVYASQQEHTPVLEISSSMDIGEHSGGDLGAVYAFTNCDYIKLYKDNEYIKTFYPDIKQFPNLKHAPVKIDDFIGDLLNKYEKISIKDSQRIKAVLRSASKYGMNLPLGSKLIMGRIMLKYKLSMDDGMRIFGTYVSNWGGSRISFRFDGYRGGQLVKSVIKSTSSAVSLDISADSRNLSERQTYDVTRVVLRALDQNGNLMNYENDALTLEAEGPIEVIGPKFISLIGGARAFWIKTTGGSGKGVVRVLSEKFGIQELEFNVSKLTL